MRSTSALYRYACDEEGCVLHSELVKLFHGVDVALDDTTGDTEDGDVGSPPSLLPPVLTNKMLLTYAPDLRFPTHITLSHSYVGDAGLAAFMRVLPMLRWVRAIEARHVGAGPRTIDALCAALTEHVIEGCEEAAAVPTTEVLAGGRLPALELVDLRDNDGIYALSGQRLIAALRKRQALLATWCGAHGLATDVQPALEVCIDLDPLPPSIAQALQRWNEQAAGTKYQRLLHHEAKQWRERVRVFTVRSALCEAIEDSSDAGPSSSVAAISAMQPVGEHIIFRIPSPTSGADGALLTADLNAHLDNFLIAACCFSFADPENGPAGVAEVRCSGEAAAASPLARPLPTRCGVRAAVQACVEFGADTLAFLPHTNATLWYLAHVRSRFRARSATHLPGSTTDEQLYFWEAKANVAALLRGLQANVHLEAELDASVQAGGIIVQRHLQRLSDLYVQLDASGPSPKPATDSQMTPGNKVPPLDEMVALYYRIVSALVARRFSADHLPSMMACEEHIQRVTEYVLRHLVVGEMPAEVLAERIYELRNGLPNAADAKENTGARFDGEAMKSSRLLPPVMALCYYHYRRHRAADVEWVQMYAGGLESATGAKLSFPTASPPGLDFIPAPMRAFEACRCEEKFRRHDDSAKEGDQKTPPSASLPAPCTTCCYHVLQLTRSMLDNFAGDAPAQQQQHGEEKEEEEELHERWKMLQSTRQALPRELRMFFLDMVIRQSSRRRGGCAFVPSLDAFQDADVKTPRSLVGWLACGEHQTAHWVKLLRLFAEWYRLRCLESYGIPWARELLCLTAA